MGRRILHIVAALEELIPKGKKRHTHARLIWVTLSQLTYNQHRLHLFAYANAEKWGRAFESVDGVCTRHGFEFLCFAKSMALGYNVRLATPSLSQ